jgi:hypothetical protein
VSRSIGTTHQCLSTFLTDLLMPLRSEMERTTRSDKEDEQPACHCLGTTRSLDLHTEQLCLWARTRSWASFLSTYALCFISETKRSGVPGASTLDDQITLPQRRRAAS